jgi:hypothetical protein
VLVRLDGRGKALSIERIRHAVPEPPQAAREDDEAAGDGAAKESVHA